MKRQKLTPEQALEKDTRMRWVIKCRTLAAMYAAAQRHGWYYSTNRELENGIVEDYGTHIEVVFESGRFRVVDYDVDMDLVTLRRRGDA